MTSATRDHRPRHRRPDDRGTVTFFVIALAGFLIAAAGLVVDGAVKVRAMQRADQAAQEAARAGSQMLQAGPAVRGAGTVLDPGRAAGAARSFLAAEGLAGTISATPARITVTASTTWRPVFLSVIGVRGGTVTATATAQPVSD